MCNRWECQPLDGIEDLENRVLSLAASVLRVAPATLELGTGIGDLPEWDSIANLSLLQSAEQTFAVVFDIDDMLDIETLEDLVEALKRRLG